jgi:simple sugar transport system permease protein
MSQVQASAVPAAAVALDRRWLPRVDGAIRFVGAAGLGVIGFALFLLIMGKNPLDAYAQILQGAFGDAYGWGEIGVKLIPVVLCALAAAIPARVGLINVGAEGQLHMGAWAATWAALTFGGVLPAFVLLPLMMVLGFFGGGIWAGITGWLRARMGLNEAIATLLLNYVAVLIVQYFVNGPWKDPNNTKWPYTAQFDPAARLPALGDSRVHLGILFAIVAVVAFAYVLSRTRWGYRMRVIGGNADAARWSGFSIDRYLLISMFIGGGLAGLAGMAEVSAIQGRLQAGISNGYGYLGFLASWVALHHPVGLVGTAFLLSAIVVGGDVLQLGLNLPAASVNVLMSLILLGVLASRPKATA